MRSCLARQPQTAESIRSQRSASGPVKLHRWRRGFPDATRGRGVTWPKLHSLLREINCPMRFEWDDDKQAENLRKHGIDLADAEAIFQHPCLTRLDTREEYGEDRWCSLGMLQGRVVVLVYTERLPDIIRVISLRKATRRERTKYDQFLQDRLGQG